MNAEEQEELRQTRVKQAAAILANLPNHKVCLVCLSLSKRTAGICNICHAYQWSQDPAMIRESAEAAAKSVFPITLGHAPTFDRVYHPPFD